MHQMKRIDSLMTEYFCERKKNNLVQSDVNAEIKINALDEIFTKMGTQEIVCRLLPNTAYTPS